jgi:hypothetical protein
MDEATRLSVESGRAVSSGTLPVPPLGRTEIVSIVLT